MLGLAGAAAAGAAPKAKLHTQGGRRRRPALAIELGRVGGLLLAMSRSMNHKALFSIAKTPQPQQKKSF